MKKRIVSILLVGLLSVGVLACSNQSTETEEVTQEGTEKTENNQEAKRVSIYFHEIKADDHVTLGDYKGIEVVNSVQTVTEEEVDAYINYLLAMSAQKEEVTDRDVVENGDIVNIDFEGKKDGVAFDGGTAQGYDLTIGSGAFIEGFEEGLIGAKKGETRELNLTFPEDYNSEELAGKEVVFTVTVNGIYEEKAQEFNDEFVASLAIENVATTEEYRAYLKNMMAESNEESAKQDVQIELLNAVTNNAQVNNVPEKLVDRFYQTNLSNMTYQAMMYGMDLDSFVSAYYGMDTETFETEMMEAAKVSANQALVCLKIAEEEGLQVTDEEVESVIEERYAQYGYENADDFKNTVDLEEYKDSLLLNKVVDFLMENATIITDEPKAAE